MHDTVTLVLSGEVTLDAFATAVRRFGGLVSSLSKEVADDAEIEWVVDDLAPGSALATVRGLGEPDQVGRVVEAYERVGQSLEEHQPPPYSRDVVREAEGLTKILNGRIDFIRLETASRDAVVRRRPKIESEPSSVEAYGAVQGQIDTLARRRGLRFTLYDSVFDRAVSCYLETDQEDLMRYAWGKRALVEGWVKRDAETGRPLTVRKIQNVEVLDESNGGTFRDARGAIPPNSEASPEEIIRRVRNDV